MMGMLSIVAPKKSTKCSIKVSLIKTPKRSGETYCFCSVFFLFFLFFFFFCHFFFFPPKFCLDEFSVTTGRIVRKFWDMVDMDVKLCKKVSKFKILDSKAGPGACPKPLKFCPENILLATEGIVLRFFYDKY